MLDPSTTSAPSPTPLATQFSLRALLSFTALAALVTLTARYSLFLFAALGVPLLVYALIAYLLRRNLYDGGAFRVWSSISASILSSILGIFCYWILVRSAGSPGIEEYIVAICVSLLFGFWFGLVPVLLEMVLVGFRVLRWRHSLPEPSKQPLHLG